MDPNKYADSAFIKEEKSFSQCSLSKQDDHFRCGDEAMEKRKSEVFKERAEKTAYQTELDAEQAR
jgi:predicted solute-binding protein